MEGGASPLFKTGKLESGKADEFCSHRSEILLRASVTSTEPDMS